MLAAELEGAEPGAKTVVDRLVDVLFVHIVRAWLATHEDERASWLAALVDTEVAAAISCLHRDPARQWSVESLAAEVGLSRPTLARRFTKRVGESPLAYLARWRLQLAARRLQDTSESLATVGRSVAYSSEFAFSRAFSRAHGMPPGRYRAAHRSAAIPRAATPGVSVTPR
jgi:AraC-like DNA-binding protein